MAYEDNAYCDFNAPSAKAAAGKDILLAVFSADGAKLLAIAGQQGLTINRAADSIDVTSKDTDWKSTIAGMKEWSVESDGLYVMDDDAHAQLSAAFTDGDLVCVKLVNKKTSTSLFGGLAAVTDYTLEAPYDDALTYSLTLEGNGALTDLRGKTGVGQMPE